MMADVNEQGNWSFNNNNAFFRRDVCLQDDQEIIGYQVWSSDPFQQSLNRANKLRNSFYNLINVPFSPLLPVRLVDGL